MEQRVKRFMDTFTQLSEEAEELFEAFEAGEVDLSSDEIEALVDFFEERLHAVHELKNLIDGEVNSGLRFDDVDDEI